MDPFHRAFSAIRNLALRANGRIPFSRSTGLLENLLLADPAVSGKKADEDADADEELSSSLISLRHILRNSVEGGSFDFSLQLIGEFRLEFLDLSKIPQENFRRFGGDNGPGAFGFGVYHADFTDEFAGLEEFLGLPARGEDLHAAGEQEEEAFCTRLFCFKEDAFDFVLPGEGGGQKDALLGEAEFLKMGAFLDHLADSFEFHNDGSRRRFDFRVAIIASERALGLATGFVGKFLSRQNRLRRE